MRIISRVLLGIGVLSFSSAWAATIESPAGKFIGLESAGVHQFRGIPYAKAPVLDRRWKQAERLPRVENYIDATEFGAICPQPKMHASKAALRQSEDCLSLNIWSPDLSPEKKLPVMVWIHGGGFTSGSGQDPRAEASHLAAKGAVVVSLNYRLGILGRFAHPALSREQQGQPSANYGLMDQVVALQWVKNNISNFGGNPENVTIFGNSAGGVSVNFLMASSSSKGLFHRAIAQSSAVLIPLSRHISKQVGGQQPLENEGLKLAEQLGVANDKMAVNNLRQLTVEQLLSVKGPMNSTNPVVDGVFIVEDLATSFSQGRIHSADYMSGVVSWEGSLTKPMQGMPMPVFLGVMASTYGFSPQQLTTQYANSTSMMDDMFADSFHASTLFLATAAADHGLNSYIYNFEFLPKTTDFLPGVPHSGEVPYVFGNLKQRYKIGVSEDAELDRQVSDLTQAYWLNFARTGNPNGKDLPRWPMLASDDVQWMMIGEQAYPVKDMLKERMAFWLQNYQNKGSQSH